MDARCPQPLPRIPQTHEIVPAAQRHNDERRALVNYIVGTVDASRAQFSNTLLPLAELENKHSGEQCIIAALRHVSPDRPTQAAAEEAERIWRSYWLEEEQRADLYYLISAVDRRNEPLDEESRRMLSKKIRGYKRNGYGIADDNARVMYLTTKQQIASLSADFIRTVREHDSGSIVLSDEELNGVPPEEIIRWQPRADGKRLVPLKRRDYMLVMRQAHISDTRRRMQTAWSQRFPRNVATFREIILLRDKNARLLGLDNHAAFQLPDRLLKTTNEVIDLLEFMGMYLLPLGRQMFQLLEAKKQDILTTNMANTMYTPNTAVDSWDIEYLRRLVQSENRLDDGAVMSYFPFEKTVVAILHRLTSFLQLHLERVTPEEIQGQLWEADVDVWSVWDDRPEMRGEFVGYLYLDMMDRQNKAKGGQTISLQPVSHSIECPQLMVLTYFPGIHEARRKQSISCHPVTGIILARPRRWMSFATTRAHHGNISRYVTLCSNYTYMDLTPRKEIGHALHDMVSKTRFQKFHGSRVCIEFGEAIGTMMENWAWLKSELHAISCHYTYLHPSYADAWSSRNPGQPLPPKAMPEELMDALISFRTDQRSEAYLAQV